MGPAQIGAGLVCRVHPQAHYVHEMARFGAFDQKL
jgi:hypothetical protein